MFEFLVLPVIRKRERKEGEGERKEEKETGGGKEGKREGGGGRDS